MILENTQPVYVFTISIMPTVEKSRTGNTELGLVSMVTWHLKIKVNCIYEKYLPMVKFSTFWITTVNQCYRNTISDVQRLIVKGFK